MTFLPFSSCTSRVLFCLLHRSLTTNSPPQAPPHLPPLFACRHWHIYSEFSSRSEQRGKEMVVGDELRREGYKLKEEREKDCFKAPRLPNWVKESSAVMEWKVSLPCYFSLNKGASLMGFNQCSKWLEEVCNGLECMVSWLYNSLKPPNGTRRLHGRQRRFVMPIALL